MATAPVTVTASIAHAPCPCGLPAAYLSCCGRWHAGALHLQAPDAQALMRSRYSAFVLSLAGYLQDTWHPRTRPLQTIGCEANTRWLELVVKRHTVQDADHATVEFVARSKQRGKASRLHEISRFVREHGRWFYLDGSTPPD